MVHDESRYPHSPDVAQRKQMDDGFSEGWGQHFQPCERHIVDIHTHLWVRNSDAMLQLTGEWFKRMSATRLERCVVLDGRAETLENISAVSEKDPRLKYFLWMDYDQPNAELVRKARAKGAIGLKMHNYKLMQKAVNPEVYLSPAWTEVFKACAEHKLPILWHVTQRYSESPGTGKPAMSYWKEQPGFDWNDLSKVKYPNRDMMAVFKTCMTNHRDVMFIGAHALHMGYASLSKLCQQHSNLHFDTAYAGILPYGQNMYPDDIREIRDYFLRYSDRILFGSDTILRANNVDWNLLSEDFLGHVRYIRELALPEDVLQKVMHENAERLCGLKPIVRIQPAGLVDFGPSTDW